MRRRWATKRLTVGDDAPPTRDETDESNGCDHPASAIRHPPSVIRHPPSVIRHPPSVIRLISARQESEQVATLSRTHPPGASVADRQVIRIPGLEHRDVRATLKSSRVAAADQACGTLKLLERLVVMCLGPLFELRSQVAES
jgi:hypothetical protein